MLPENIKYCGHSSEAGNNFQHNLLKNLQRNCHIEVLSYLGFPTEKENWEMVEKVLKKSTIHYVLHKDIKSRVIEFFAYYYKFLRLIRQSDLILLYNYHYINFFVLFFTSLFHKKAVLIIADHTGHQEYSSVLRRYLAYRAEKDYVKFDALIILSKELFGKIEHKRKLFFPGAIDYQAFADFSFKRHKTIRILYAGLLNEVTGIDLFLSAIKRIFCDDVEFVFTGRGPMREEILEQARSDHRIVYKGFISREAYYELLNDVDIVINPRNMQLQENQNNFPSKIMEYLASGRLILSTRFAGWEDFTEHVEFVESKAEDIATCLEKLIRDYPENARACFERNRLKAQSFDWRIQIKRIERFIGEQ